MGAKIDIIKACPWDIFIGKVVKNKSKNKKQAGPLYFFVYYYICKAITCLQSLDSNVGGKSIFLDSGTYINRLFLYMVFHKERTQICCLVLHYMRQNGCQYLTKLGHFNIM